MRLPADLRVQRLFRSPIALVSQDDLRLLKEMLETGKLTATVDRRYPLGELPAAVRALAAGHSRGKSVITIR